MPSSRPGGDDQVASADFYLGDWQTDIGLLHIENVGTKLAGTLRSDAGVAQVDVVEADERYLRADFYGPIDAPWLHGLASGPEECSEARHGTTYWGTLSLRPWGDGEIRGTWAPCDPEWQRRVHLYSTTWVNDIAGTRIVEDREPASDVSSDSWNGIWSTNLGELELTVFRGVVNGSFDGEASADFKHAWATLYQQAGDPGSIAGKWMGEYGTHPCRERPGGVDYWGYMWLERDGSGDGFTGGFDYCAEQDGGSISGHMITRTNPPRHADGELTD